ncbi:MAG: dockerin type I repeat-containing protein [Ruminococcus sp.]|nr:dockerin type I repeat-containing protein [Ruminococcus sp.]
MKLLKSSTAVILSVIIAICVVFAVRAVADNKTEYILGDANSDGVVTISDVTAVQMVSADISAPEFNEKAGDIDGNGLDVTDAHNIQRYVAMYEDLLGIGGTVTETVPTTQKPTNAYKTDPYELPFIPD